MISSETEICNLALDRLAANVISSLTEGTVEADRCARAYAPARDAVLRAHPWNFAIRRVELALDETAPTFEFDHRHALPTDCLKVIRTNWDAEGITGTAVYGFPGIVGYVDYPMPYRIEGRYLLSNETSASIEYVARVTDVAQFDDMFVDVLAQRLAAELCYVFTQSTSMTEQAWKIYANKLEEARSIDAQEGTPRPVVDVSGWLVARR
jgi:hypothetical protein